MKRGHYYFFFLELKYNNNNTNNHITNVALLSGNDGSNTHLSSTLLFRVHLEIQRPSASEADKITPGRF